MASSQALSAKERDKLVKKSVSVGLHAVLDALDKHRLDVDTSLLLLSNLLAAPVDEVRHLTVH